MISIIMPVKNRYKLTEQAVKSLYKNTKTQFNLVVVDDASDDGNAFKILCDMYGARYIRMDETKGPGAARNAGAAVSKCSPYIYFTDNDVYFEEGWDIDCMTVLDQNIMGIVGADGHPLHSVVETRVVSDVLVCISTNQVGYSMMLRRGVWEKYGPFKHFPIGLYGAEDTTLCNTIKDNGYDIGYLSSRKVYHCGLVRSDGQKALGYEHFVSQSIPDYVYREYANS